MALFGPRIRRVGPGRYRLDLSADEQRLLASLLDGLREVMVVDDPTAKRLFPTAYPNDAERDAEYQALVHDELLSGRLAALETVEATLEADELDRGQLEAWLGSLNSLRLVLGTKLDASEELPDLEPDDPDAPAWALYEYLGILLETAVHAITDDL